MLLEPHRNSFLALDPHGFHRVAIYEWGDPRQHHVVVCVHGLTRNGRDFDILATHLAQHCRVVSMDVVGRGASEWLVHKGDYGFPLYLADAATLIALVSQPIKPGPSASFIRRLTGKGGAPFIDWVGTSMGGLIGMVLASRTNSPIRRLVLNDVGPFISWQALANLKGRRAAGDAPFSDIAEVERHIRQECADFGPLTDEQWTHVAEHSVERLDDGRYAPAWDPAVIKPRVAAGQPEVIEFGSDFLLGVDLWPVWNAVRCPTLVLRGAESGVLSAATADRMRNSGPPTRIVEFAGIGHAPWLMGNDQTDVICDFLFAPDAQIVG
jgi:pimeloyl-ACP methyl ester carboxylesterase